MNAMADRKTRFNRRAVASQSMQAAAAVRQKANLGQVLPICIYDLCSKLAVPVRFNNINMEGMYQRAERSQIHLSALRPLQRRVFNCAHELGHHVFGHGSSIDELREDAKEHPWEDIKEFQADTFAGFLLMPIMGLRRSFSKRGWSPEQSTPSQIYALACEFGVGYSTLLSHLSVSAGMLSFDRARELKRTAPKMLKAQILGSECPTPLAIVDTFREAPHFDVEVGTKLILPAGSEANGPGLVSAGFVGNKCLFTSTTPGKVQVKAGEWSLSVRIMPNQFTGLAQFRHLEQEPDE